MQDPSSYTFELTDRAGTNLYAPYGDGPARSGWKALSDSHNTVAANASFQISWQGTAITVNGIVNSSQGSPAYMLSLDGQQPVQETLDEGRTNAEILLSKSGLPSGYHTLVISNIKAGNLTVKGVQLSISTGASRDTWTDTSTAATLSSNALWVPNPFFTFGGNWFPGKTSYAPPMLTTSADNTSVLSFSLAQCSSFFLYGPMAYNSGAVYTVQITPPVHSQGSSSQTFNSTLGSDKNDSFPSTKDEVLFWESGMDRNMNYTVDVNIMAGGQWGISKLVTFDATDLAPHSQSTISTKLIVAIVIGVLIFSCLGGASSKKVRHQVTEKWALVHIPVLMRTA